MKTNLPPNSNLTFFVIGVPRTGTTLVSNIMNSLDDGFCFGEPHWYWMTNDANLSKVKKACFGKVKKGIKIDRLWTWKAIYKDIIIKLVNKPEYSVGGYKETFRHDGGFCASVINTNLSITDFFIITFRDPVMVLSSLQEQGKGWKYNPTVINNSYLALDKLIEQNKDKAKVLTLENLTDKPRRHLNNRLPFNIVGDLKLHPTRHEYGDYEANHSRRIEKKIREISINKDEISRLKEATKVWLKYKST